MLTNKQKERLVLEIFNLLVASLKIFILGTAIGLLSLLEKATTTTLIIFSIGGFWMFLHEDLDPFIRKAIHAFIYKEKGK